MRKGTALLADGVARRAALARDDSITIPVRVPARGRTFPTIEAP